MSKPWKNLLAGLALIASGVWKGQSLFLGGPVNTLDVVLDLSGVFFLVFGGVQYWRRRRARSGSVVVPQ